jgi:hypothetical protein
MGPFVTSVNVSRDDTLSINTEKMPVEPGRRYRAVTFVGARRGEPRSACFTAIVLDPDDREIARHVRWVTDFTGQLATCTIAFRAPARAKNAIVGYRCNVETPAQSDLELLLPDNSSLALEGVGRDAEDQFDEVLYAPDARPDAPAEPAPSRLSDEEEDRLEKKVVWLFGAPRSGTTWLGTQLLAHPENIIWNEPFIGYHLGAPPQVLEGGEGQPWHRETWFFAPGHQGTWAPPLRKLILARTHSQAQTLRKNIIIKEPNGIAGAHVLLACLPGSKVLFLLRDGRDVVESLVDAHRPDSWNEQLSRRPLVTGASRREAIQSYAESWAAVMPVAWRAFHKHNPDLRLLVRYQALRENTLMELKRIYGFLGVPLTHEAARRVVERYDFDNLPDSEKGPGRFCRAATTGGWRTRFSEDEQGLMNSIMGETLREMRFEV